MLETNPDSLKISQNLTTDWFQSVKIQRSSSEVEAKLILISYCVILLLSKLLRFIEIRKVQFTVISSATPTIYSNPSLFEAKRKCTYLNYLVIIKFLFWGKLIHTFRKIWEELSIIATIKVKPGKKNVN